MKEGKEHYVPLAEPVLELITRRSGKLFRSHERQMLDLLNPALSAPATQFMAFIRVR